MKNLLETYDTEIIAVVVSSITTIIITFLSHLLNNSKLRYEQRVKITGELAQKKYEGITKIRNEIIILSKYEDLCITEDQEKLIPENIGLKRFSPACCYTYEALFDTASKLNALHGEYGHYLRHTTVVHLIYIRNFLMDYGMKCKRADISEEELRWASIPIYLGLHKWYKKFDKELIKSINKPSTKHYAHSGFRYNLLLLLYGRYFKKTEPYTYMNDENSLLNKFINNYDELVTALNFISDDTEELINN